MHPHFIDKNSEITINYFDETEFPLILSLPHSGRNYKKNFLSQINIDIDELRISEDIYLDKLFSECLKMPVNSMFAEFPRVYVDVNRERFEISNEIFNNYPEKINFLNSDLANSGIGVIHTNSSNGTFFYNKKINWESYMARLESKYDPWYESLDKIALKMLEKFSKILILDCHSMPTQLFNNGKKTNFEFAIGDYNGSSCSSPIVNFLKEYVTKEGFKVGYNEPFSGKNILKTFGKPNNGVNAIQLEISKGLYIDEKNFHLDNIKELQFFLKNLISALSEFIILNEEFLNVAE
jgi:N-formylglutamate amidohydrolase